MIVVGKRRIDRHWKEFSCGKKAGYRNCVPACHRVEARVDIGKIGNSIFAQADHLRAIEKHPASVSSELLHATTVQNSPDVVLLVGVIAPVLLYERGKCIDLFHGTILLV
jgi:hypothetical protein